MTTPFGDFGAPPDVVAWAALVLAALAFASSRSAQLTAWLHRARSERLVIAALAVSASLLSVAYVSAYLRGGPRIIDATSYFLQGRALSEGLIRLPVPSPSGSFRGRFLLSDPAGHWVSGIFPPGYPALLSLGFLVGAPLLVGPAIAAALVVATYAVTARLFEDRAVARLAAALSVVCAVLRHHTAETMSHGWSALLLAVTVWSALGRSRGAAAISGASAGMLVATRPVSGALALVIAAVCARRRVGFTLLAALPSVALFLLEQRVATGTWLGSTQLSYYALADGPEGCLRYGFGSDIGCRFEHGDFVRAHLEHGYGLLAALGTTLRRLKMHLPDAANCELFMPVLAYALGLGVRRARARVAVAAVLGIVAVYAPFYFDGNYPGGGARFFADVLPLEHALLAFGVVRLGLARAALPLALASFALHTAYDHQRLREREGGRPMYEPRVVKDAGVRRGLLFVDTDHGFGLAHDPAMTSARDGIVVARRRNDAHDAILWDRLGRPPAFAYEFPFGAPSASPRVVPLSLELPRVARFESEAEWPPLLVDGGFALPDFPACASGRRALVLHAGRARPLRVRSEIVAPSAGRYRVTLGGFVSGPAPVRVSASVAGVSWDVAFDTARAAGGCSAQAGPEVGFGGEPEYLEISTTSEVALDYAELSPAP